MITFYNATAADLAYVLHRASGVIGGQHGGQIDVLPVRDKTLLTGRYDFTITLLPKDPEANGVYRYSLKHLGLAIQRGTEQRPALVIDHIERPSPN